MINNLYAIYKVNANTKGLRRRTLFDRFAFYTEIVFKCGTLLYFLSILGYFVYPMYMYWFKREIVTLMPTYIPGINERTASGFVIVTCYHVILLVVAFVAATSCDFLFTMLIANTPVMAILIEMEVQQLNEILTSQKTDVPLLKSKFRNILLMHREMTEYDIRNLQRNSFTDQFVLSLVNRLIRTMDITFFEICFAQIVGATGGNCVAIFVIMIVRETYLPSVVHCISFVRSSYFSSMDFTCHLICCWLDFPFKLSAFVLLVQS